MTVSTFRKHFQAAFKAINSYRWCNLLGSVWFEENLAFAWPTLCQPVLKSTPMNNSRMQAWKKRNGWIWASVACLCFGGLLISSPCVTYLPTISARLSNHWSPITHFLNWLITDQFFLKWVIRQISMHRCCCYALPRRAVTGQHIAQQGTIPV